MNTDLKPVKAQRMRDCIDLALNGHLFLPMSSQGSGNISKKRGKKIRTTKVEMQQRRCLYELTTVGTACTRPVQDEARHKWGVGRWP